MRAKVELLSKQQRLGNALVWKSIATCRLRRTRTARNVG